ncbi:MAG TPA: signal recognition particle-docking protein FtsY [Syntrophales bacterium]|nr:signal recognition particle-docking protein FtsY [Syntrophales bacterium]
MGSDTESKGLFERLKTGLARTRNAFIKNIDAIFMGERVISQKLFEELEETLIMADVGPAFTYELIAKMKEQARRSELGDAEILRKVLRDTITDTLKKIDAPLLIAKNGLFTIMMVGVNGTGKTTTIGKLAHNLKKEGTSVMLVAADTFRAAAIEQLEVWSQRVDAPLIKQKTGADPSAVVFDAIVAAKARKADALIIDTAGRLHTKVNLMEELKKMKRIIERELPNAPHEILLVLDATTGQNAVVQAKMFNDEIGVTGIILTKLDGTAKGGVIIGIARELNIPIRYIGIGERLDDLKSFNSAEFVEALFEQDAR